MDKTEQLVQAHLIHRGFTGVDFEPDGNSPPDFAIDGNIAIEARRLNQNYFEHNGPIGLEETSIPLWFNLTKLVSKIGPAPATHSWYVSCRFRRPVESWKTIKKGTSEALQVFVDTPNQNGGTIATIGNFEIDRFPASRCHSSMFVFYGLSDDDADGSTPQNDGKYPALPN